MTHARPSRITAAAGTRFAGTVQEINVIILISIEPNENKRTVNRPQFSVHAI